MDNTKYPIASTFLSAFVIGVAIWVVVGQPPTDHPKNPVSRLVSNP